METRANYVLIGLFTLAAIFGAAAFIYWFQHLDGATSRKFFAVQFDGSVSGLRTGSAVVFNGMRVGEVTSLRLDSPNRVVAMISVEDSTPIKPDTQVGLDFQGLTGLASLSMRGGSPSEPTLASPDPKKPTLLNADPSLTRDITAAAREVLGKLDKVVSDNEEALRSSIRNIESVTTSLANNTGKFERILANLETMSAKEGEIAQAARSVRVLADNLDKHTTNIAGDFKGAADSFRQLTDNLDKRTAELATGINRLTGTGSREIESLAADGRRTLSELDRAIRNFDKNPSRLLFGGGGGVPEYNGRR